MTEARFSPRTALHIAHNVTEKGLAGMAPRARGSLIASVEAIARAFPTVWTVDAKDPSPLPPLAAAGRVVRCHGMSIFGATDSPFDIGSAETVIASGADAEIHVNSTLLGAIDRGHFGVIVADAIWSPLEGAADDMIRLFVRRFVPQATAIPTASLLSGNYMFPDRSLINA